MGSELGPGRGKEGNRSTWVAVPPNAAQLDPAGLPGRGASCWGVHPGQNPVPTLAWPGKGGEQEVEGRCPGP